MDVELLEDLPQVVLDGPRADEEAQRGLPVALSLRRKASDSRLLCREVATCTLDAPPRCLTSREQLTLSTFSEALSAHRSEELMRSPQLLARIDSATFTAQP